MATETPIGRYEFEQFRQANDNQHAALGNRIGGLEAKLNYVLGGIAAIIALAIPVVVYVVQDWLSR